MSLIGARIPRIEDDALLRGRGRFVDDLAVGGLLHAAFVRSPHPHALIRGISTDAARSLPGVHAVLTLDDLAPVLAQRRMIRRSYAGNLSDTLWPFALADREVSYVGEPVVLVIADSRYLAEDAAAAVAVDYEALPAAVDCREALRPGAPPVRRELASNNIASFKVSYGDVTAAFASPEHIVRTELWQHRGAGHPIEGRGIVAEHHGTDDAVTAWASTQKAHDLLNSLNACVRLDDIRLRVATPDVGGGFGPKLCVYSEDVAIVAAARLTGRSIKWIEDRREHFTNAAQERDQYWSLEIALDADAKILGIRGRLLHDQGAYALQDVNQPYNSAKALTGPYVVPALHMDIAVAATNKTPVSSVRGAGYPQASFAMERLLDAVAREVGIDRAELRRRNLIPADKMPYSLPLKERSGAAILYDSGDYPACQAEVLTAAAWDDFPRRQRTARAQGRHIGIGLAHALKGTGRGPFESGIVRIAPSGRVSVFTGAAAMGQGLKTALAQICAQELGVKAADVRVVAGDTATVAVGLGGFASRQTVTAGSSVLLAARAVRDKAKKLASHLLEAGEHDLEVVDGAVRVVGASKLAVGLGELSRVLQGAPGYGFPDGLDPGLDASVNHRLDALAYANACHVAEVEVDIETGGVRILRYCAIQDSGTLINPMLVTGQVEGGVAHGLGNALLECMVYDAGGQPMTTTFAEYLLPGATEVPAIDTLFRQTPSPLNPLGAKGAGEVGTIPAAAAVMGAIEDALSPFGVRITQTPLPPQRILELIAKSRTP
ncbi:MAG TPA: xanthine dehydrogenase family protein molybdopterin-binding subunit [Xanthobacteraceae bacterium]|nr:xanthine dehydrogenase family protein molybdopterin-binding subunit [Xanthobacteraceae bacterium]